jgi:hypothetical protein
MSTVHLCREPVAPSRRPTQMKPRRSSALALLIVPLLTACGARTGLSPAASGGSHGSTPGADCCAPMVYNVSGHLSTEGGPAGTEVLHWPGTIRVHGPVDRTVRTDAHGKFHLRLLTGTYQLTGHSPQYDDGKGTCRASGPLVVHTDTHVKVDVVCQLK